MASLYLKDRGHPGLGRYFNGKINWASRMIVFVPVFGLVVAWAGSLWSDFSQPWFLVALGIWFATVAIVSIFVWPVEKTIHLALEDGNCADGSLEQRVKRAVFVGGISSIGYVAAFYLMLFKP